ncbi:MAG: hypothetical protein ABF321_10560 [Bacteroidia bacterium]
MASSGMLNLAAQYFKDFYRDTAEGSLKELGEEIAEIEEDFCNMPRRLYSQLFKRPVY